MTYHIWRGTESLVPSTSTSGMYAKSILTDRIRVRIQALLNVARTLLGWCVGPVMCAHPASVKRFIGPVSHDLTALGQQTGHYAAKLLLCTFFAAGMCVRGWAGQTYTWTNFVGKSGGPGNADGIGTVARFELPRGAAADALGNIYVADSANHIIRKLALVGTNWVVTTLAGTPGLSGTNDGLGRSALFNTPVGLILAGSANIYVADSENHTIRKMSLVGTNWVVTTFAGAPGVSGTNDGVAAEARFNLPTGLATDSAGNIYVADANNNTVRKIVPDGTNWLVTTLAGLAGEFGTNDGVGSAARFRAPGDLTVDSSGNIYVADTYNHAIRKVTQEGVVTTLAGLTGESGTNDGTGVAARFFCPGSVVYDNTGNLFVADGWNHTIRRVSLAGEVTTVAGKSGSFGFADGVGSAARFFFPGGLCVGFGQHVFVADEWNNSIRMLAATETGWQVTTIAGTPEASGTNDGPGALARFNRPYGLALTGAGDLLVADNWSHTIRSVSPAANVITVAGLPLRLGTNDGLGVAARFYRPASVAADGNGTVYIADWFNHTIRKAVWDGQYLAVTTLAGLAGVAGTNDGVGSAARFFHPRGVALHSSGVLYVADEWNHVIRKVTPDGAVTTFAGLAGTPGTNDGSGTLARFYRPCGVAVDVAGYVFVAEAGNHVIRKISPAGLVTTLAGLPGVAGTNDGTRYQARFNEPTALALDSSGNLFVADSENCTVRMVTQDGTVTTIGGVPGVKGGADGVGSDALFALPVGVAVDQAGNVYVADAKNNCIVKGVPIGTIPEVPVVLGFARYGTNFVVWWPTNAVGFTLEYTTNLPATSWVAVASTPVIFGDKFFVTNAVTGARSFYRLRKP